MKALFSWLGSLIVEIFEGEKPVALTPTVSTITTKEPAQSVSMPETPQVPSTPNDILVPWNLMGTSEGNRHNVRVICDQEGLTEAQKDDLSSTVHCESNYNPACLHPNMVNGKLASTDYGIAQINDYYHIGEGKDFTSSEDVLQNPEACIRWMCNQWKAGNANLWVCHLKGLNLKYSS